MASPRLLRRAAWLVIGLGAAGLLLTSVIRGDAAGADFEAYWVAAREWLAGRDPYDPPDGVLPYAYAPWALPLFVPFALLPSDEAFAIWRAMTVGGLSVSVVWAGRRRPLSTAVAFTALAVPIGINLDTGNVTLPLALLVFGSAFGPVSVAGLAWGASAALKPWALLPLGLMLDAAAQRLGLVIVAAGVAASLVMWPMTLDQLRTIAAMERPFPIDYLVLIWATVPWLWRDPSGRRWLRPGAWVPTLRESFGGGRRRLSRGEGRTRGSWA